MFPQRIVSLVPSLTELLFDLGAGDRVVGITKFCVHPPEALQRKTVVGGTKTLHLDRIHALRPDLILANKEENVREQIETLRQHYPVHVTDVATLPDALAMIRKVGHRAGDIEHRAEQMAQEIEARFATLRLLSPNPMPYALRPLRVAYLIWREPYMTVGHDTFIHAMLEAAGFQNVFANQTRYPDVAAEALRSARPDWIFLSSEPYPFRDKHVAEMQVVCPSARVRLVDGELFSWYGSRLLRSADYFSNLRQEMTNDRS